MTAPHKELFGELLATTRPRRAGFAAPVSLVVHAAALTLLVLLSLSRVVPPATERDPRRIPLLGAPPVALPPLPKGTEQAQRPARPLPMDPQASSIVAVPDITPVEPSSADEPMESAGSPLGIEGGIPEGSEAGKEGGQVGGVPWGVANGVVDGTGEVPVANPDRPPRLLHKVQPEYPQVAFTQKVQGTVVLEILIGATGRVVRARVTHSVPGLDDATVAAVLQWVFVPAVKDGRPVASVATVPVKFQQF